MSNAYRCENCDSTPDWRVERVGDAVVTWSCALDLGLICQRLQRAHEQTRLVVTVAVIP